MRGWGRGTAVVVAVALVAVSTIVAPLAQAAGGQLPSDVRFVSSWTDPLTGLRWDRYQQYAAPLNVFVDGGQLTVIRNGTRIADFGGAHYDGLRVTSAPRLSASQAISSATAAAPAGASAGSTSVALTRTAQLRVDPATGGQFYRVASSAPGTLLYQDIDANTGAVLQAWSGIEYADPTGTGVKGDGKTLAGDAWTGAGVLTTPASGGGYQMVSADNHFTVVDANNIKNFPTAPMTDSDDSWVAPRQAAAVDAQYYAALTAKFYAPLNVDLYACIGTPTIRSVVHYGSNYDNAFWDPNFKVMAYGDGNGSTDRQLSGAQDVVSHELSHAVTSCHSDLDYTRESGALNEAFSDIMATTAEHDLVEPNSSNCIREEGQPTCFDWWIAEDLITGGSDHAFRSFADPEILGQPSHYSDAVYLNFSDKLCPAFDNCGVHYNSGIANHAFYLLANGGRNARCSGPTDSQADCDVAVPGIGIDKAAGIFMRGWFGLTSTAKFCDARASTIEQAQDLVDTAAPGYNQDDVAATELAWDAVGVYCSTSLDPFVVTAGTRAAAAKPGGSAQVTLSVVRHGSSNPISFSVDDAAPASASFTPPSSTGTTPVTVQLTVPGNAAPGVYPMTVTATDGTNTQHIPIVLLIDSDNPTAQVSGVQLTLGATVATDGHVPLQVAWSTNDATSGVASGSLSADATQFATGTGGPSSYSSLDGSHSFQASATDLAGNSATSGALSVTQTSFQETAPTYVKTWTTATTGSAWGNTLYSKTKGATATLTFTGTDVAWVSSRGLKRGKAKVYIDGVKVAVVDLKAATTKSSVIVYTASGLAAGQHTIKIYVNGTAGRPRVDVDGFVVLSPGP